MVPFDKKLIDISLLTEDEIEWLDNYHSLVNEIIAPLLDSECHAWVMESTLPLIH